VYVLGYAFVRRESEQNSSLQLLQGAAVEVPTSQFIGLQLGPLRTPVPCDRSRQQYLRLDQRREFVPFALAACLAAAVSTTKVIVTIGLAEIVASACESADMQMID
jgi:hypothetical protein